MSRDPLPTPKPADVSPGPGCTGSEWEENATRAQTNVEVSQSNTLGLSPTCPCRDRCRDTPSSPPHGSDVPSGSSEPPSPHPGLGILGGVELPRNRLGNQPHVPALACPVLSRIPNPSHMVSISLGSAGACSAVSELTFPCLSMQLLARDARPSPRPWSSPALPVRTRLSRPRGGCGEAGAGSCLCSALKLQPGRASGRLVPGEVPAPACLLFPWLCQQVCSPPWGFLRWDGPTGWMVPGTAPKHGSFTPKCSVPPPGLGWVPRKATESG